MKFLTDASGFARITDIAVAYLCFKDSTPKDKVLKQIDVSTGRALTEMFSSGEFDGSAGQTAVFHKVPDTETGRILLAGLGDKAGATIDSFRQAAGRIARDALDQKIKSVSFFYDGPDTAQISAAVAEGFALGAYKYLEYKTDAESKEQVIERMVFVTPNRTKMRQAEKGIELGEISSWAVSMARDLSGRPGNSLYPESFARHAKSLSNKYHFRCRVFGMNEIKKERMGGLIGVGQGSDRPPRFIILEYNGRPGGKPIVLIGKGITFDAGGISIKPGLNMEEMKGDMTGAAVVMSAFAAAVRLGIKQNLIALIPSAENLPSGKALKPGDILTMRSGKTVEIINTDAEGRLILADALDYAGVFDPQAVIDIATLTGASLYVLGYSGAPFVGTNAKLNDLIEAAAEFTGEKVWELPLWQEFADRMKSSCADLKNSGGKPAGTLTAASFLKAFIGEWPWAHIDIAYCDIEPEGKPYVPRGATGFGTRLLLQLLMNWKKVG
jgi:leucyl aminopeptidase